MRALILRPPAILRRRPAAGQPELEQGLLPSFQMNQLRVAADEGVNDSEFEGTLKITQTPSCTPLPLIPQPLGGRQGRPCPVPRPPAAWAPPQGSLAMEYSLGVPGGRPASHNNFHISIT